mmetsp:Transcript_88031/g.155877  ORF Transcript_88031/g.155877 Transcript_88031/m.155877 type:complete len:558 (+) Transcript_88031:3-1676(+)
MLTQAVDGILPSRNRQLDGKYSGTYVDCTFGRGGHSREILKRLSPEGRLYAFDVDPTAISVARRLEAEDDRFKIIHRPFGELAEEFGPGELDGVLADLGVSSPQLDEQSRGFNSQKNGPLDMRMNQEQGISASQWLQEVSAEELAWVIHKYGEDEDLLLAQRIAAAIIAKQGQEGGPITQTRRLADIVCKVKEGINELPGHPAKLVFQAIRIFLNHEMLQLDLVLQGAMSALKPEGRCAIIVFKKTEANIVKRFVREHEEPDFWSQRTFDDAKLCEMWPLLATDKDFYVAQAGSPLRPTEAEIEFNSRCRSSATYTLVKHPRRFRVENPNTPLRPMDQRLKEPQPPRFAGGSAGCRTGTSASASGGGARAATMGSASSAGAAPLFPMGRNGADAAAAASAVASSQGTMYASVASSVQGREVSPVRSEASDRTAVFDARYSAGSLPASGSLSLTNAAPDRDAQPASGINAALGSAFTSYGFSNQGNLKCFRVERDHLDQPPGYLQLRKGQMVIVNYEGSEGSERGWYYGALQDNGEKGWFLPSCLEPLVEDDEDVLEV